VRARASLALLLLVAVGCGSPALATPLDPNQVKIVTGAGTELPYVAVRVVIYSGSTDDPPGREGLAYFTASLMRRDASLPGPADVVTPPSFELSVAKDEIVFSGRASLKEFDSWYTGFRDMILTPRFDPAELEKVRIDQRNVVEAVRQDDASLARESLDLLLYRNHPYGHLVAGRTGAIDAFTREDALAFHRAHVVKGNVAIGLAGPFSESIVDRIRKDFDALPDGQPPRPASIPTLLPRRRVLLIEKESRDTIQIRMGEPISVTRAHADYFPLRLAAACLGEPGEAASRLNREIRSARGISESVGAGIEEVSGPGTPAGDSPGGLPRREQMFSLWLQPKSINAKFAIKLALAEVQDLSKGEVSGDALDGMRTALSTRHSLAQGSPDRRLIAALDEILVETAGFDDRYAKTLAAVTVDRAASAAKRHLTPEHLGIVAVVSDAAAFVDQMISAETLIEYPPGISRDATRDRDLEIVGMGLALKREDFEIVKAADLFR
jgi:zinc protease